VLRELYSLAIEHKLQLMREKDVEFFQRVLIRRCAWVQSEPTLRTWLHPPQRLVPFLLHEPLEHTIVPPHSLYPHKN
jgi:hypothetical protein